MPDEFYTVEEVAAKLKVTTATVYRWVKSGELKAQKISPKMIRISHAALREYLGKFDNSGTDKG